MAEPVLVAAPLGAPGYLVAGLTPPSWRVIPYEHPGHLHSTPLGDGATMRDYAHALVETASASGARHFALVGFGFGAMVALQAALDRPDRVSRLVLVSASAAPGNSAGWRERAAAVRAHGLEALAPGIVERWTTAELRSACPGLRDHLEAALLTCSDDGYAAACEAIAAFDVAARLPALEPPTLMLAGAEDVGVPPEHGRRLAAAVAGARYEELEGAGHLPFLERPDVVRSLIAEHLGAALPEPERLMTK